MRNPSPDDKVFNSLILHLKLRKQFNISHFIVKSFISPVKKKSEPKIINLEPLLKIKREPPNALKMWTLPLKSQSPAFPTLKCLLSLPQHSKYWFNQTYNNVKYLYYNPFFLLESTHFQQISLICNLNFPFSCYIVHQNSKGFFPPEELWQFILKCFFFCLS